MKIETSLRTISQIPTEISKELMSDKNFAFTINNGKCVINIDDEYIIDIIRFFTHTYKKTTSIAETISEDAEKFADKYYKE